MVINNCRIEFSEPLTAQQLNLKYNPEDISYTLEEINFIEGQWQKALLRMSKGTGTLFNGNLFALKSWCKTGENLELTLCNTNYKNYVGTRNKDFRQLFPASRLADPLAVCAAIQTSDGKILMEKRKGGDVYSNSFHVIGGFMDRDIDIKDGVVLGPFYAIKREIKEEALLNISEETGILMGLVYDERTPHPEICFSFKSKKSLDEIARTIDNHKTTEIGTVFGIKNNATCLSNFLTENIRSTSVTGFGCLLLHGRLTFGNNWLLDVCSRFQ